ncbi:protein sax-3-like [Dreissena polymorpha]|uniref:protein sax-3-like n=1 Tax=Dreissena polymorpha TaxID=45954 RepID=UPI00226529DA|nr:protein sax-3-like [Dreissena polymorpha]
MKDYVHNVTREYFQNNSGVERTIVLAPPEILTPPGNKAVTVAERVVLACSVGGDPPPKVVWLKNGRPVKLSDRIRQLNTGSLVIYDFTNTGGRTSLVKAIAAANVDICLRLLLKSKCQGGLYTLH